MQKTRCWNSLGWECWTLCKWSCAEGNALNPFLNAQLPWQNSILSTSMHCRKMSHGNTSDINLPDRRAIDGLVKKNWKKKQKEQGLHFPCCIALQTHSVKLWMLLFFSNLMTETLSSSRGPIKTEGLNILLAHILYMHTEFERKDLILAEGKQRWHSFLSVSNTQELERHWLVD